MNRKKNVIIAIMMVAMLLMATGYAYFASRLNITATGNITGNWNVYFSKITEGTVVGNASNKTTPSINGTTANIDVNLKLPGDSITYELTLTNAGTIDAVVEEVNVITEGTSAIIYTISGIEKGDKLTGGNSIVFTIKTEYDSSVTSQPNDTSKSITISINCVQDTGQSITPGGSTTYTKLSDAILSNNNVTSDDGIDFSKISSDTNGKGLYQTTTDKGTVYYFRGDVTNNYVQFGEYQKDDYEYYVSPVGSSFPYSESTYEACLANASNYGGTECEKFGGSQGEDMYWRIVRINEDGTIKLVYAGTDINTMTGKLKDSDNSTTWGGSINYSNSPQKTNLETWYANHLESVYGSYIADNGFCNDTEVARTVETGSYYGDDTYYKGYDRVIGYNPTYNCSSNYSLSVANGKLSKPIGILTADEVMYAGGVVNTANTTYYLKYVDSVTMTPSTEYASFIGQPDIYRIDKGTLTTIKHNGDADFVEIYPTINLRADVEIEGNGTVDSPYVVNIK